MKVLSKQALKNRIAKLPRERFALLPTPLHELKHFSEVLGGPRIFVKREDLSGLATGGNKARKLEFAFGKIKQEGCDFVAPSAPAGTRTA